MNFGLALAKPGESRLGLTSRLWLANQGAWRLDSVFINQRVDGEIARHHQSLFAGLDGNPEGLAALQAFEQERFPEEPRALLPKGLRSTDSVRQCFACAQDHYHSLYFNTPWLDECPIHNSPLLTHCPTCNKAWPSADDIQKRQCETCGIRRKAAAPMRMDLFGAEGYDAFRELDTFFSQSITIGIPRWTHLSHLLSGRSDEFSKTLIYPSVLAAHRHSDLTEGGAPAPITALMQPCQHTRFKFKPAVDWNEYIADNQLPKMSRIRKKVVDAGFERIQALADHPIGSCQQNPNTGRFDCVLCEASSQLSCGVYQHAGRRQPLASYQVHSLCKERYLDPGLVQVVQDPESNRLFTVPPALKLKLYELDILSCVKRLMLQVQYAFDRSSVSCPPALSRDHTGALGGYDPFTNYYYFVIEGDYCHLYYPDEYEDDRLFNFENWLSITRTF